MNLTSLLMPPEASASVCIYSPPEKCEPKLLSKPTSIWLKFKQSLFRSTWFMDTYYQNEFETAPRHRTRCECCYIKWIDVLTYWLQFCEMFLAGHVSFFRVYSGFLGLFHVAGVAVLYKRYLCPLWCHTCWSLWYPGGYQGNYTHMLLPIEVRLFKAFTKCINVMVISYWTVWKSQW